MSQQIFLRVADSSSFQRSTRDAKRILLIIHIQTNIHADWVQRANILCTCIDWAIYVFGLSYEKTTLMLFTVQKNFMDNEEELENHLRRYNAATTRQPYAPFLYIPCFGTN
jgi:hypothetical protein